VTTPQWSPKGDAVLFLSLLNEAGQLKLELWMSGLAAGSERLVYAEKAGSEFGFYYLSCTNPPVFTPDGAHILFTSVAESTPRIVTVGLDGHGLKVLVATPSVYPALDAAGRRLAYVALTGATEEVRVLELATGKVRVTLR
jgi:Tol biopolymer transport system component